ncbi:MAG: Zn-ribbon domain-containing OB-fold protein [Pseudomonadota bacterium]
MHEYAMAVDGLVVMTDGAPHLLGSRCGGCGVPSFPPRQLCPNPACAQSDMQEIPLPRTGVLYSHTMQRYQPPPPFRMDNWQPYTLALVDLGEGLRVMGMMTDLPEDEITIGMPVQLVLGRLFDDADRGEVYTYKFAPLATGAGR